MKHTVIQITLTLAGLLTGAQIFGLGGAVTVNVDAKVAVATCNRGSCPVTINAVGDKEIIDVSKYTVTDLGTISEVKTNQNLSMPTKPGELTIYSFIPTEGDIKGKKILVAFKNQQPRPGSRFAGLNVVKVYRQIEGEKDWTEAGSLSGQDKPTEWSFAIYQNGDFKTIDPKSKKEATFDLGVPVIEKAK